MPASSFMHTYTLPDELIYTKRGPHLTILIPTHRYGKETDQGEDRAALKSSLQRAEEQLKACNLARKDIKSLLAPIEALFYDPHFWHQMSDGLAIFASKDDFCFFQLPIHFTKMVYVSDRFYLKEVAQLYQEEVSFYLLQLSQGQTTLFEANRYRIQHVEIDAILPENLSYIWDVELENILNTHASLHQSSYEGYGSSYFQKEVNQVKYLKEINEKLMEAIQDQTKPLLLACSPETARLYHELSAYPKIEANYLFITATQKSERSLHTEAVQLMLPYLEEEKAFRLQVFEESSHTKWASSEVDIVVPAAYDGRVQTLFTQMNTTLWGQYQAEKGRLDIHQQQHPQSSCLLNQSVIATLQQGGDVYNLPPEDVPGNSQSPIAAILRY